MYAEKSVSDYEVFDRDKNSLFEIKHVVDETISYKNGMVDVSIWNAFISDDIIKLINQNPKGIYLRRCSGVIDQEDYDIKDGVFWYCFDHIELDIFKNCEYITKYNFSFHDGKET